MAELALAGQERERRGLVILPVVLEKRCPLPALINFRIQGIPGDPGY